MSRSGRSVALALLACALTACGSTVQVGGGSTVAGVPAGSDGLGVPAPETSTATTGQASALTAPSTSGPATGAAAAGSPSAPGVQAPTTTTSLPPATTSVLRNGPGITAKTVGIGVPYDPNAAQNQAALGSSAPVPAVKRYFEIVIADINKHGGIAGRTLKAEFYPVSSADTSTSSQKAAAACAFFTQDHPVLAVMPTFNTELSQCLNKAGVVSSTGSVAGYDERTFQTLATYFDVQALASNRLATNLVTALKQQGYFTGWDVRTGKPGSAPVKVGILAPDSEQWRRTVPGTLVPALARIGVKVDPSNIVIWHFPDNAAGQSESVAQIQSAVLRFQANGVTHLIPAEVNSAAFFATPANSQRYRPRFALNTATATAAYAGSLIPYEMLAGAVGLGWSPAIDLPAAQATSKKYAGPGLAACLAAFKRAQVNPVSPTERAVALVVCDVVKLFKASVEAVPAGHPILATSVMSGLETLGNRFPIAGLPAARFGPGRHYPVTRGWAMRWDAACRCLAYAAKATELQ